ncbi:MAG: flippase-like domain-containing protein [Alphaproteobacteria bacterium]|nr:flippase-like domain-containing protein [Alphaproteobacteria bacterium]
MSLAVVLWFQEQIELGALRDALSTVSVPWFVGGLLLNTVAAGLHEGRTWLSLPRPRPRILPVLDACFAGGLINLFVPMRGGDVATVVLLRRSLGVSLPVGAAAIGLCNLLEMLVFALGLPVLVVVGLEPLGRLLGETTVLRVSLGVAGVAVAAAAGTAGAVVAGRWMAARPGVFGRAGGVVAAVLGTIAGALSTPRDVLGHGALAALQVVLLYLGFMAAMLSVGIGGPELPLMTASLVAASALASLLVPSSWGVGLAGAAGAVFDAFGLPPELALSCAAVHWLTGHVPAAALGFLGVWRVGLPLSELTGRAPD